MQHRGLRLKAAWILGFGVYRDIKIFFSFIKYIYNYSPSLGARLLVSFVAFVAVDAISIEILTI
jgi:hypothetical protein